MSGISDDEKKHLSKTAALIDEIYSKAFDELREELIGQGIDLESKEGKRIFILAVRKLNERFI
ncbi:MAG: hypothetical protein HZA17_02860 [Nitrospirae bacterium]|nr:hypothetical protein [Nitrospirota bacterium]